jgi:RNA polymerase sigma factor (TIGR02999 family)
MTARDPALGPESPVPAPPPGEITTLLRAWSAGDASARDRLMPVVYSDLRRRAARFLRRERPDHTLRSGELVHEAYLRLLRQNPAWHNRDQFFGVASSMMRRILVDHARARAARKRGGPLRVLLDESHAVTGPVEPDLLDLDQALSELSAFDERQARLVELRYFTGLGIEDAARVMRVSVATANREWAIAKAWLYKRLRTNPTARRPPSP